MKQRDQARFLAKLWQMESTLVVSGMPAMPKWWRDTIERFYLTGKRRLVVRKGRRVFASTCVAPRLAAAEMIFGEHRHLPGTPPIVFAFLSVKRGEAANRLKGVSAILDALGVKYTQRGDNIELSSYPAIFSVVTANFRTSVGETVGFAWCDEVARWRDDESGANPAEQVVGSLAPALATLPDARLFLVSTPLGREDFHARQFDIGTTELQETAFGATWEINPTLSETECRKLEPTDHIFQREYGGIPQAARLAAFPSEQIARAFEPREHSFIPSEAVIILDPSSGGLSSRDQFTWCVAAWHIDDFSGQKFKRGHDGQTLTFGDGTPLQTPEYQTWLARGPAAPPYLRISEIGGIEGGFQGQITGEQIAEQIARLARKHKIKRVNSDQREALFLESELRKKRLRFHSHTWTAQSKQQAVTLVRRWLSSGVLSIEPHEPMRRELLGFEEVVSPAGMLTFGARGGHHDDFVALLITLAHCELNPQTALQRSPMKRAPVRGLVRNLPTLY